MKPLRGFVCVAAAWLAALAPSPGRAADWTRYENGHFVAYSNADDADARRVLEEFEYIRAAADQAPALFVPQDRPKTVAILVATRTEFLAFVPYRTIAGIAVSLEGTAAIAMPVEPRDDAGNAVVRHEFGHTLLFNPWFRYPPWYAEGFAEIVSTIAVDRRRGTFTVGRRPPGYGRRVRDVIDWQALLDASFDAHALADPARIRAAYAQSWLLVHYLMLGANPRFGFGIERYFGAFNEGTPSIDAFEAAFGATPDELWRLGMSDHARQPPERTETFDPSGLDLQFVSAPAADGKLAPLLRYLRDSASVSRPGDPADLPIGVLVGFWDTLRYVGQCDDPLRFVFDEPAGLLRIDAYYSAPGEEPVPAVLSPEPAGPGIYRLRNVTANEYPRVTVAADYQVTIRSESVVCFDALPARRSCQNVLHACDRP